MQADILQCKVAIGGDVRNVLHATGLTWPEVCVMSELHGENSVSDILVTGSKDIEPQQEFDRIRFSYPVPAVKALYPGVSPNIKWGAPDYIERETPKAAPVKKHEPVKADAPSKTHDLL